MTPTGIEPVLPPWKGDVLTAWPRSHISLILKRDQDICYHNSPDFATPFFIPSNRIFKKVSSTLQPPLAPIHGGISGFFLLHFLHMSLMNILQKIFTDHYEEIIYTILPL